MRYLYIFGTIIFTVLGQMLIKWRVNEAGQMPAIFAEKATFIFKLFLDPYILLGLFSAVIASIFWLGAMAKFEISQAYPFMSLSFIIVLFLSSWFLGETITIGKILGLALIIAGLIVSVKL